MRRVFLFVVSLFVYLALSAQVSYTISFDKSDFKIVKGAKTSTIEANDMTKYFYKEDISLPALPYYMVNVLIPADKTIVNISVSTEKNSVSVIEKDILIQQNPEVVAISDLFEQKTVEDDIPEYKEVLYPASVGDYIGTDILQGFVIAHFIVCPFSYNAKDNVLSFVSKFSISFDYKSIDRKKIGDRQCDKDILKDIIINSEEIDAMYGTSKIGTKSSFTDIDYLIITSSDLEEAFLPLVAWKIQKGLKSEIITTDSIFANYSGATNQLKIKNCIYSYYENKNVKWVLLGGDDSKVPVQGCYARSGSHIDKTIPCDMFYACFDKSFDWDNNGNDTIGEVSDNVDLMPEVYISRMPARRVVDVQAMVDKTLNYERNPILENHVKTMLLCGKKLWDIEPDGRSDAHAKSETMYTSYISPYWNGAKTKFYDTGTDFTGDSLYEMTATNLQTQLNGSYHFVHMATHGSQTGWSVEKSANYISDNASSLANTNQSIILTMACNTNAFDSVLYTNDPCLSEAFLRNPRSGCVLYWGSSRYGWGVYGTSLGPSISHNAMFLKYLFNNGYNSFAKCTAMAKSYWTTNCLFDNSYRWLQFSLNAMGDPELPMYTDGPFQIANATVTKTGDTIVVNTGGISGCTIAVTSNGDLGRSYFNVFENVSTATFYNVPENSIVTITKTNYIPYRYLSNIYIQNETFTENAYFSGENIFVGHHVTTIKAQGDVFISNDAQVTLEATNNVRFDTGVHVKLGAKLNVR